MCGIFGMFGGYTADERRAAAAEALRLMHHRGPDDSGALDLGVGLLVNRRLAIVDLAETGHQPMTSADGQIAVTFNGEIYNYVELQEELSPMHAFRGHSDTEVILAAYIRWGDACLQRLRGMFALAIWDAPRQRLLCATDRLSIKPVLYHLDADRLVFASEVKPIAAAGVRLAVNARRLVEFLQSGQLDHSADTLYAGIQQLRPGTYLVFEGGRLVVHRYWDLPDLVDDDDDRPAPDGLLDRVDALLQETVDLHLRGDVEPGLSLSSGLDSQVLRALIQRRNQRDGLHCFTHCFPGTPYDECGPARAIAAGASVHFHGTDVPPDDFLARLDALVHVMEGPVGGLGIYGYWLNCRTAAEHGFKVLLDGQGGDEAFAGYRYYYGARLADLQARGDTAALMAELTAFNQVHGTSISYPGAAFDELIGSANQDQVRAPDGTTLESDYLPRDLATRWSLPADPLPMPRADRVKAAMYRDLFALKIPKLLRFQDRAAMASSVEVRVPFLDHVLLEALWKVPSRALLQGGLTKSLLRRFAADRLGVTIDRPKLYVSAPQREWLKGPLRGPCRALVQDSVLGRDGWIDAGALLRQYDAYCASPRLGNSFFIWKFVTLELWYRRFISPRAGVGASPSMSHV